MCLQVSAAVDSRLAAIRAGTEWNQEGVFHLKTHEFVDTKGSGEPLESHPAVEKQVERWRHRLKNKATPSG